METDRYEVSYRFELQGGNQRRVDLCIDARTVELIGPAAACHADWTALGFYQCPNCTLDAAVVRDCPAAVAMLPLVESFRDLLSYEEAEVEVITPERRVGCHTSIQRALSSLMGLVLAASGCPRTRFFKPMARFHLPFATEEETFFRAAASYLLGRYFLHQQGASEASHDLSGLQDIYRQLQIVNRHLAERLRAASEKDSAVNALILLDLFARAMPPAIRESLEEIRYLFVPCNPE